MTIGLRRTRVAAHTVMAIATDCDAGPAVTNAAEEIARAIHAPFLARGDALRYWEHDPCQGSDPEACDRVLLRWNGTRYVDPSWRPSSHADVERVLGAPLPDLRR